MPKLLGGNEAAVLLFRRMLPGLGSDVGGWNYAAIGAVFDIYGVEPGERPILLDQCLLMMQAISEIRESMRK